MNNLKVQLAELFYIDGAAVNLSKSTLGIAIALIALILLSTIGTFGFTLAFGAVLAVAIDGSGPLRQRVTALSAFALAGALVTLLGNGAGQSVWASSGVIFGVTLICGLALALGPQVGQIAFLINLWMMFSLSLSPVLYAPVILALGFFCGCGIVAVVLLLLSKTDLTEASVTAAGTALHWNLAPLRAQLDLRSPIMQFALSRALVAAFAMWLGWQIAPDHPFWIPMTLLIVMVPDRHQAARTGWQRAIGTVIGVVIGAVVLSIDLPQITLLLLWLLVTLLMLALQDVNYVLYASILTLNLILLYQLLEADVLFNGIERLITTLLGIVFAVGTIVLLDYLAKKQSRGEPTG